MTSLDDYRQAMLEELAISEELSQWMRSRRTGEAFERASTPLSRSRVRPLRPAIVQQPQQRNPVGFTQQHMRRPATAGEITRPVSVSLRRPASADGEHQNSVQGAQPEAVARAHPTNFDASRSTARYRGSQCASAERLSAVSSRPPEQGLLRHLPSASSSAALAPRTAALPTASDAADTAQHVPRAPRSPDLSPRTAQSNARHAADPLELLPLAPSLPELTPTITYSARGHAAQSTHEDEQFEALARRLEQCERELAQERAAARAAADEMQEERHVMAEERRSMAARLANGMANHSQAGGYSQVQVAAATRMQHAWRVARAHWLLVTSLAPRGHLPSVLILGANHIDNNIEVTRMGDWDDPNASVGLAHGSAHLSALDSLEAVEMWQGLGGKALNFAAVVAQLGVHTHLVSVLGQDHSASLIRKYLRHVSSETHSLSLKGVFESPKEEASAGGKTGSAYIIISQASGKRLVTSFAGTNKDIGERELAYVAELLHDRNKCVRTLLLALEIPIEPMVRVVAMGADVGTTTLLRLTPLTESKVAATRELVKAGVNGLLATVKEARMLCLQAGSAAAVADAEAAAELLLHTFASVQFVVVSTDRCHLLRELPTGGSSWRTR